ncbi:Probable terpene synthase 2 [Linum perenne]
MSILVSEPSTMEHSGRRRVEFHPSVWNDFFARPGHDHPQVISGWEEEAKKLTEQVKGMLNGADDCKKTSLEMLEMIDAVQRLGLGYRFEPEIEVALLNIFDNGAVEDEELYTASLRFRLLRQQGYPVNPAVFEKFKDEKGTFKEEVGNDVKGLLSLYEASYYRVNGEPLLDEALEFARTKLELIVESENSTWASQVRHSLKWPILKGLPIRESRHFMSIYEKVDGHNEAILKLGKLDFNLVQKLHQHELKILTKWETRDDDNLPSYFKHWFNALLDVFAEIEAHVSKEGRLFCMYYAREGVKQIARAFIKEARWYNNNYVATVEEHLQNGYMSIGYPLAITVIYCGMGEVASEEVFEWLFSQPKISVAGSTIARLMDDIVSHEFEQERGHVASTVECYMKQHGVSKEEAHMELNKLVEKLWKDMNEDMLRPLKAPMPVLLTILNKVRVMDLLYKDEDTYTNSKTVMKELLTSLLVDPVPI